MYSVILLMVYIHAAGRATRSFNAKLSRVTFGRGLEPASQFYTIAVYSKRAQMSVKPNSPTVRVIAQLVAQCTRGINKQLF